MATEIRDSEDSEFDMSTRTFIYLGLIRVMRNGGRGAGSGLCKQGSAKAGGIGGSSRLKARAGARLFVCSQC